METRASVSSRLLKRFRPQFSPLKYDERLIHLDLNHNYSFLNNTSIQLFLSLLTDLISRYLRKYKSVGGGGGGNLEEFSVRDKEYFKHSSRKYAYIILTPLNPTFI